MKKLLSLLLIIVLALSLCACGNVEKGEETKEHMKNYYCMIYKKNDGKTYGRVIELDITNSSERTQNYIDYIMGNIYTFGY